MDMYRSGAMLIQIGAAAISLGAQIADIVGIGLGFQKLAKAVMNAPRLSIHSVQISRFVRTYTRIELRGNSLLIQASRLSITQVRVMQQSFTDWSKAIEQGVPLFFNVLHFIQGQTA